MKSIFSKNGVSLDRLFAWKMLRGQAALRSRHRTTPTRKA
jgi:hypothetical protein